MKHYTYTLSKHWQVEVLDSAIEFMSKYMRINGDGNIGHTVQNLLKGTAPDIAGKPAYSYIKESNGRSLRLMLEYAHPLGGRVIKLIGFISNTNLRNQLNIGAVPAIQQAGDTLKQIASKCTVNTF